jgi:hypothetical protein
VKVLWLLGILAMHQVSSTAACAGILMAPIRGGSSLPIFKLTELLPSWFGLAGRLIFEVFRPVAAHALLRFAGVDYQSGGTVNAANALPVSDEQTWQQGMSCMLMGWDGTVVKSL